MTLNADLRTQRRCFIEHEIRELAALRQENNAEEIFIRI